MCSEECVNADSAYSNVDQMYVKIGGGYASLKETMSIKMPQNFYNNKIGYGGD